MLGVRGLPPPSAPPLVPVKSAVNNPFLSFILQHQAHKALPNCPTLSLGRTGSCLYAQKRRQNSSLGSIELVKEAIFDEEDEGEFVIDEYDDEFDDEDEEFDDDDDDDDVDGGDEVPDFYVPFDKMDEWFKRKPKGFGEGKVYDTSIEDKLLEEIEMSRKAQLDNLNRLKDKANEPKKELKAPEGVPNGIRVRINNLPKKKNVHRDLKSAFEGVPGLVNISPVVSGNKKTRDPVCKGFGFVDFNSLEDANRFVQMFSGQHIAFGKVEKLIKCEILKPRDADHEDSTYNGYNSSTESRTTFSDDEGDQESDSEQTNSPLQFWDDNDNDNDESDEELDDEDIIIDGFELSNRSEQEDSVGKESEMKITNDTVSSKKEQKIKAVKKKSGAKKKSDKIPKLNIPGSAAKTKRLKVREKAKLADVFSRYGSKEALASKQT